MNHNQILGVGQNASAGEIKKAFRKAAKEYHPDLSDSPEAAEAFARIRQAHDELLKRAGVANDLDDLRSSTAAAATATAQATYATGSGQSNSTKKPEPSISPEELERTQELDQKAAQKTRKFSFNTHKEDPEITRHRKKIRTTNDRIEGKY